MNRQTWKRLAIWFALLGLLTPAALSGIAQAQSITWLDQGTRVTIDTNWYMPKTAADFNGDVVVMGLDQGTSLGPMDYWVGRNPLSETSLDGTSSGTQITSGGFAPSVGMLWYTNNGTGGAVVETHQGGQDSGTALWSEFASYFSLGTSLKFADAQKYDEGYYPSVAVDPNYYETSTPESDIPQAVVTSVVEVHQEGPGNSELWYHVGTLAIWWEAEPSSLTWGKAYPIDFPTSGSFPSVTVCNGTAIEVHEGASGTLWYSMGTVSGDQISWGLNRQYDVGYNPSIVGDCNYLVEVHQADSPAAGVATNLWYHSIPFPTGYFSFGTATKYDVGCSPSIAFAYSNYNGEYNGPPPGFPEYLVETHTGACGETDHLYFDYGWIP